MHLVESAPFNKGRTKVYSGVPGNLVAFACKLSFQPGHRGNVSFLSKTQLISHYEKILGAFYSEDIPFPCSKFDIYVDNNFKYAIA
jgi:hypothetical protein